jgi:hypothetical protein
MGSLGIDVLWAAARRLEHPLDEDDPDHNDFNGSILCCLPKSGNSKHEDGHDILEAKETRPLTIADCANRLIANSYRYRWEGLIDTIVDPAQRGFLPGRSMLHNVTDIEHTAMITALSATDGAMVLFDFSAAFPSISRKYLLAAAAHAGLPEVALQVIRSFYYRTNSRITMHGELYDEELMSLVAAAVRPSDGQPLERHSRATSNLNGAGICRRYRDDPPLLDD